MKEPLIFNRLGSLIQANNSVIGLNGVVVGSPSFVTCKFGNGFDSDVNGKYVDFAQAWPDGAGTVDIWFKPNANFASMGNSEIIGYKTAADRWSVDINAGNFRLIYPTGGSVAVLTASPAPTWLANDLVNIRVVYDNNLIDGGANRVELYIDQVLKASTTNSTDSETNEIRLGGQPSDAFHANGVIDNFYLFDYAITNFANSNDERWGLNDQAILL